MELDLMKVNLPSYSAGIKSTWLHIIHIPGKYEYDNLDLAFGVVLFGYKTETKILLYDCVPLDLWYKKRCDIIYAERLKELRSIINEQIQLPLRVLDLPMQEYHTPAEMASEAELDVIEGFDLLKVIDSNSYFDFNNLNGSNARNIKIV